MKKKIISILSVILAVALTACGDSKDGIGEGLEPYTEYVGIEALPDMILKC